MNEAREARAVLAQDEDLEPLAPHAVPAMTLRLVREQVEIRERGQAREERPHRGHPRGVAEMIRERPEAVPAGN